MNTGGDREDWREMTLDHRKFYICLITFFKVCIIYYIFRIANTAYIVRLTCHSTRINER